MVAVISKLHLVLSLHPQTLSPPHAPIQSCVQVSELLSSLTSPSGKQVPQLSSTLSPFTTPAQSVESAVGISVSSHANINIIATNNFYYGQFFFDDIFMNILKMQSLTIY